MKFLPVSATLAFAMLGALPRADGCEVVAPAPLEPALGAWLGAHPNEAANCLMLVVVAEEGLQTLVLTTRDGRVARRTIEGTEELEETIDALLLAPPPPPKPAPPAQPPEEQPVAAPAPPMVLPPPLMASPQVATHHLYAATGAVWHPEPGIGLFAIETGWSWQATTAVVEAGVRWSPLLTPGGTPLAGFAASSSDLWVAAGLPLLRSAGSLVDAKLRAGWQTFAESAENPDPAKKNALDLSGEQWLVGGALSLHHPLVSRLALRTDLNADVSLTGLRAKGATTKGLPALPALGLALLVGLEVAP